MPVTIVSISERGRYQKYSYIKLSNGDTLKLLPGIVSGEFLFKGRQLTSKELQRLLKEQLRAETYHTAVRLLSRRAHSKGELNDKLARRGYPRDEINNTIRILEDDGYIDDENFTKTFVDNRLTGKPSGKRLIYYELYKRKVPRNIIDKVLNEIFSEIDESEKAYELLEKCASRYNRYKGKELKARIYRYLRGRGFCHNDIIPAINRFASHQQ